MVDFAWALTRHVLVKVSILESNSHFFFFFFFFFFFLLLLLLLLLLPPPPLLLLLLSSSDSFSLDVAPPLPAIQIASLDAMRARVEEAEGPEVWERLRQGGWRRVRGHGEGNKISWDGTWQ